MKLRPATLADLVALLPARLPRRLFQAYVVQMRRSEAFTVIDEAGVAVVGGFFPDDELGEREAWMHLRAEPRVRVRGLLEAVVTALEACAAGAPITAHVDASEARNLRFAEFLGFVILHEVPATKVTPRSWKLVRRV